MEKARKVVRLTDSLKNRIFNNSLNFPPACSVKSVILSNIREDDLESVIQTEAEKIAIGLRYKHDIIYYDSDVKEIGRNNENRNYAIAIQMYNGL